MPKEECYFETCDAYTWLTAAQAKHLQETGNEFFCSAGHGQHFLDETSKAKVERLEKEVADLRARLPGKTGAIK